MASWAPDGFPRHQEPWENRLAADAAEAHMLARVLPVLSGSGPSGQLRPDPENTDAALTERDASARAVPTRPATQSESEATSPRSVNTGSSGGEQDALGASPGEAGRSRPPAPPATLAQLREDLRSIEDELAEAWTEVWLRAGRGQMNEYTAKHSRRWRIAQCGHLRRLEMLADYVEDRIAGHADQVGGDA